MVQYAWLIPALPLAALIIVLLVTRPLDVARAPACACVRPHRPTAAHGAARRPRAPRHRQPRRAHARRTTAGHGGHDEHGGGDALLGRVVGSIIARYRDGSAHSSSLLSSSSSSSVAAKAPSIPPPLQLVQLRPAELAIDFRVDTLTAIMLVVVTGVSMLVHLYSIGYMAGDPGFSRFFMSSRSSPSRC